MRAARLHAYTDDPSTAFTIEAVDPPTVRAPDDVVVDVVGAGWCHTDNLVVEGAFSEIASHELPYTPGHENAGVVAAVGDAVTAVAPGDPVVVFPATSCGRCRACRAGEDMHCPAHVFAGLDVDGGFAEVMRTKERSVVPLDSLDPVEAAPLADAGLTAYRAVKKAARELVPGDYALLVGVGGVGHIGLQALLALSPAETIAVDVEDAALDLADECGAHHVVNAADEDPASAVEAITDGRGVAQIVDFAGADDTLQYGIQLLAAGGDHQVVGNGGQLDVPGTALVGGELAYRGSLVGNYNELEELVVLAERGDVDVRVSTYDLESINDVARRLHDGDVEGRAVFTP